MGRIIESKTFYVVTWITGYVDSERYVRGSMQSFQQPVSDKARFEVPSAALACWIDHNTLGQFPTLEACEE